MSVFADYTPDEQRVLLRAINAAAVLVSTASPSSGADTASTPPSSSGKKPIAVERRVRQG